MQHHKIRLILTATTLALLAALLGSAAAAQTPDLSGSWSIDATAILAVAEANGPRATTDKGTIVEDCTFEGTASLSQDGTDFSGPAELDLVNGVVGCAGMLNGEVTGTVDPVVVRHEADDTPEKGPGTPIAGQINDPTLGVTNFSGNVDMNNNSSGSYNVTQGPFSGASGSWSAQPLSAPLEIPTATPGGLASLVVLLTAAALFLLIRR